MNRITEYLASKKVVCWDFDGVIKDSVYVKSDAFEKLFAEFGVELAARVRAHHIENVGVSRFDKMPIYLSWVGLDSSSKALVQEYCDRFARMVVQGVFDSKWVFGVKDYIDRHYKSQIFYLVTATPQSEMEEILNLLEMADRFYGVFGAPTKKTIALAEVLKITNYPFNEVLMVGDADADLKAAEKNGINFLLRETPYNQNLREKFEGLSFKELTL